MNLKKYLLFYVIIFSFTCAFSQSLNDTVLSSGFEISNATSFQKNNLSALCKVWGLVKYYHHVVSHGSVDMDLELFTILPKVYRCQTKNEFNEVIQTWIATLGKVEVCKKCNPPKNSDAVILPDFKWLNDETIFSNQTIDVLEFIKQNPNLGNNHYISKAKWIGNPEFTNEKKYENLVEPDAGFKLLSLFRYWNMIHYFFPYKDIIGEDWNDVLSEFIPKYINSTNNLNYHLTTLALIARIHDTHANIYGDTVIENFKGKLISNAQLKCIENKLVVTNFYNLKLKESCLLHIGDIITSINNKKVDDILIEKESIYPSSNKPTQLRNLVRDVLRFNDSILPIEIIRGGSALSLTIPLIDIKQVDLGKDYKGPTDTCFKELSNDVAYFNLGTIKAKYLSALMKIAMQKKGIVIDLRCYPAEFMVFEMDNYLLPFRTPFVKFTRCNVDYPGYFEFSALVANGKTNEKYYKGKVVFLINEITQSQSEYTTMALKTAPNALVIGSTTAGADGNVSAIYLPGNIKTVISGLGVYYPNGKPTQRIGILPDITLTPTIKGVTNGRDELLERAIVEIKK